MSDRPERPPVWVRGGPPYFYHPRRPSAPSAPSEVANEELRRASTTSSIPSVTGIVPDRSSSISSTTSATQNAQQAGVASTLFPFMAKDRSGSMSSESGTGPERDQSKRRSSHSEGSYAGLMTQKRMSEDPLFASRRESWREQAANSRPDDRRFLSRWWDNFVKGERQAPPKNK
ncbi:hypothetical protein H112_06191 [Trichophyton rubrum D6]|uniref:Uncharacterized protein n=4 Tax=Trichophyton TaxID=5550 RepID=A0A178F202_TRIRU|nr:uncharacterized protein TERG_01563 [Trichophyton rubrum CBS 118892]EZF13824.1 hypothetical protein H100_06206 [Trichophyton rubrum MR850]EZF39557.1 hypothetical protein H102_06173 [Trichophyton rubrum CBS 100081]EZF50381.1 hypothetical protein H103_06198 [Trichophyton rubrum CBS 288.86]EZF60713.1 hypothetical protein H104_06185 [Trichophyton rubrum CBS 289.86]EZF71549.1 hypothetical protein H105_06211 [Trichophyton soudanense CBS 452.61]EZF82040.1 hypothetical protein H110_06194 [Trichophy